VELFETDLLGLEVLRLQAHRVALQPGVLSGSVVTLVVPMYSGIACPESGRPTQLGDASSFDRLLTTGY
jgi:hypothetical protein